LTDESVFLERRDELSTVGKAQIPERARDVSRTARVLDVEEDDPA
jgi:hypothetical protein